MFSLRDFLYLDKKTLKNYLSSIEKGLVKEVLEKDVNEYLMWDFEVSLGKLQSLFIAQGIPVPEAGIKRIGKNDTISVQITREPTIESQFDQLFSYLEPVM